MLFLFITQIIMKHPHARFTGYLPADLLQPAIDLLRVAREIGRQRAPFLFIHSLLYIAKITDQHITHQQTVCIVEHQR
ncbi:hypothetical protein D3C73_1360440 [compost metagenome]